MKNISLLFLFLFSHSCNNKFCPEWDAEPQPDCICPECGERNCGLAVDNPLLKELENWDKICAGCWVNCGFCPKDTICNIDRKCVPGGCRGRCDEEIYIPAGYVCLTPPTNPINPCSIVEWVDAFYIEKYEVTIRRYKQCVKSGVCQYPFIYNSEYFDNPELDNHPVTGLDYFMLEKFCRWEGKRLPTWQEWMRAACSPCERDGNSSCSPEDFVLYPWGNEYVEPCTKANEAYCVAFSQTVGAYPEGASFWGLMDTFGNVDEWLQSYTGKTPYPPYEEGIFYPYIRSNYSTYKSTCIGSPILYNRFASLFVYDVEYTGYGDKMGGRCARSP